MCRCARAAPALLLHVSLLLALYGGSGLATSARLKWDPSTYILVRELFPLVYHVAVIVLTVVSVALIVLGHLAVTALSCTRRRRRVLLYTYALLMAAVIACEVAFSWWVGTQVSAWLCTEQAQMLQESLEIRHHVQPILQFFGKWHPLPEKVKSIMEEAEADFPRNAYVAVAVGVLAMLLQPLAVALALLSAKAVPVDPARQTFSGSTTSSSDEEAPLKAAYRNGRLVLV